MIAIDTIAVENEVADNRYPQSELDDLIYNAPLEYADLILTGNPEAYLQAVTEYKPLDETDPFHLDYGTLSKMGGIIWYMVEKFTL